MPRDDDAVADNARAARRDGEGTRAAADARRARPRTRPRIPDLPAAAGNLFLLTVLSTVDGSLVALAATGRLSTWGGAVTAGLTVIAGAGSWIAARQALAATSRPAALRMLAILGAVTLAATLASVYVGTRLATAVQLHVVPKAAGVAVLLVATEVAGLRLPRVRGVPAPLVALVGGVGLEVASRWIS